MDNQAHKMAFDLYQRRYEQKGIKLIGVSHDGPVKKFVIESNLLVVGVSTHAGNAQLSHRLKKGRVIFRIF